MADKYLINSAEDFVVESLYGFSKINPGLWVDLESKVVFDSKSPDEEGRRRVSLIAGGGSGHEPFPTGYVGRGMLAASVSGEVFASPPPKNILTAIRLAAAKSERVLLIVPNYTGDVLNFGLAAEMAADEDIKVESLVLGENIAQESQGIVTKVGKGGTCGLVLAIKFAGYLAETGENCQTIKDLVSEMMESTASLGLCVSPCGKPGGGILFHLEKDQLELGVGVHGEAGIGRIKHLSAEDAVRCILSRLIGYLSVESDDRVIVLVNNLGSLTHMEQYLIAGEVEKQLGERGIAIIRFYAGTFFTSLNMAGVQICLSKVNEPLRTRILHGLDSPTVAPAWQKASTELPTHREPPAKRDNEPIERGDARKSGAVRPPSGRCSPEEQFLMKSLMKLAEHLIDQEVCLNLLDSSCGDGDCGTTFKRLASAILIKINEKKLNFSSPAMLFSQLSSTVHEAAGGTTGALYGLFLRGISRHLESLENVTHSDAILSSWRAGIETIKKYSAARLGDRTMLDSLETGCDAFQRELEVPSRGCLEAFRTAVAASKEGCERTKLMVARAGRASQVDPSKQTKVDAGAYAVTIWLSTILATAEEMFSPRSENFSISNLNN